MRADELHDLLSEAAGAEPVSDRRTARASVSGRARRHQARRAGAVALVVLTLVGLAVVLVDRRGDDRYLVGGDVPRLIPDPVPPGLQPQAVVDLPASGSSPGSVPAVTSTRYWLWRPAGATGWDDGLSVQQAHVTEDLGRDAGDGEVRTSGDLTYASRIQGDTVLVVMARGGAAGAVEDVLASAVTDPSMGTAAVPDGYERVVDGVLFDPVDEGLAGGEAHSALWTDGTMQMDRMLLVVTAAGPDAVAGQHIMAFQFGGPTRVVDVDGQSAVLYHQTSPGAVSAEVGGASQSSAAVSTPVIVWQRDGLLIRVQARGFSDDEAIAVARSLRPASDAAWAQLQASASDRTGVSGGGSMTGTSVCETTPEGATRCSTSGTGRALGSSEATTDADP